MHSFIAKPSLDQKLRKWRGGGESASPLVLRHPQRPSKNRFNNSYNVSIKFSIDKRDPLPASMRSGANFNVYPQFFRIENRASSKT